MAEITATLVKELREKTQAGMMDCKKALTESAGDFEAAIKWLREKGLSAAAKRAEREVSEGVVDIKYSNDKKLVAIVELNCETDFVARNDNFKALLNQLLDQVLAFKPKDFAEMETQKFIGDDTKTVADVITTAIATIGENLVVNNMALIEIGESSVADYIHMGGKIGVLVEFTGKVDDAVAKDVAMHIAAINPLAIDRSSVPADSIEKEKEIYRQQAINEGKPENIADKIVEGRVSKFYQESCLLEQGFVKDPEKKVKDILPAGVTVKSFKRFQIGA